MASTIDEMIPPTEDSLDISIKELQRFTESYESSKKDFERQHADELLRQKTEFDIQFQIEKQRADQLDQTNRTLNEQLAQLIRKHADLEQKQALLVTKYNCCAQDFRQIKEQNNDKKVRIEKLEKNNKTLSEEKDKLATQLNRFQAEHQALLDKVKETAPPPPPPPPPPPTPQRVPDEYVVLIEKAIHENLELKASITERDRELVRLKEQLSKISHEDPHLVEQRLLQLISKLKSDFRTMYENQSNFFVQKLDQLKQEQRDNMASLNKH